MTSSCLTPRDRAAVLWAEHVTLNTAKHRDDVFEEVRKHYTDPEIVELTAICGLFNMANRVHDSLRLPIEDRTEVDKIKTSVRPDPQRLKTYLENMVGAWTDDLPDPEESERG